MRRFLIVFILIIVNQKAQAVDPGLNWQTLETGHFYIHFIDDYRSVAEKTAGIAERVHDELVMKLEWQPEDRTHLVLSDATDLPNGFAMPFPFNRSVLYLVPPDELNTLEDFDDWLELLITHEYVHVLHLDMARGGAAGLRYIFGRNILSFPNIYQPPWIIEGLATYHETDHQRHIGRGQSTLFEMMMREEVTSGIKPVSQVNLRLRSWPMGTTYYLYGVHFFQFLDQRYGPQVIDGLVENYSDNIIPFAINSNAERVLDKDMTELWAEFEDWLMERYQHQVDAIRQHGVVQGDPLTNSGYYSGPVQGDGVNRIYYVKSGAFEHAALYAMNAQGGHEKLVDVHARVRMDVHGDAGVLIAQLEHCDLYNTNFDLFLFRPDQDELVQLTECGRYRSASWSPDASKIIAVHTSQAVSEMHMLDSHGNRQSVLWQGRAGEIVGQPDWSPNGRYVVASVFRPGRGWNIEQFDLDEQRWQSITHDHFIDAYPKYDESGSNIVFSSERNGEYNIYRHSMAENRLHQLTRATSGAFKPWQANASSPLYYVGYSDNGYDVHELKRADILATVNLEQDGDPVQSSVSQIQSLPAYTVSDYSPWWTMRPRWWFPVVRLDEDRRELGITTSGTDALDIHRYVATASYDDVNEWVTGSLRYYYGRQWSLGIQRETDILFDQNGDFAVARKEDTGYIAYSLPWEKIDYSWHFVAGAFSSHEHDGRRAPGIQPLPDFDDHIVGAAVLFNNSHNYIRSISRNDGRDVRLIAETSDVWDSDYSGEVYTLDWREYLPLGGQHVLALRFVEGYGTDSPDNFELGGEETDFVLAELFTTLSKPVIGRREYPLRGYKSGLVGLTGRRMQLASLEYRFPIALVERGLMAPPVGVIQWAGSIFADTGATWNDGSSPDDYVTGVGVELHGDISLFYGLNLKMRLGYASGLDEQLGDERAYFSLGAAF